MRGGGGRKGEPSDRPKPQEDVLGFVFLDSPEEEDRTIEPPTILFSHRPSDPMFVWWNVFRTQKEQPFRSYRFFYLRYRLDPSLFLLAHHHHRTSV